MPTRYVSEASKPKLAIHPVGINFDLTKNIFNSTVLKGFCANQYQIEAVRRVPMEL